MIVIDASVAVQWVVREAGSELSDALLGRDDLMAPDLLLVEAANALRRKEAVGDTVFEQAEQGLAFISENLRLEPASLDLVGNALRLARDMAHPIYDCIYLALAETVGGQLVTHDRELLARARRNNLQHLVTALPVSRSEA